MLCTGSTYTHLDLLDDQHAICTAVFMCCVHFLVSSKSSRALRLLGVLCE